MGRRATVTLENVKTAIDSLTEKGLPIRNRDVRALLGAGSMTTIGRLVTQITKATTAPDVDLEIPEGLKVALLEYITKCVKSSIELHESRTSAIQQNYDDISSEYEQLESELESSETEVEVLRQEGTELRVRLAIAGESIDKLELQAVAATKELEQTHIDLAKQQLQIETLTASYADAVNKLETTVLAKNDAEKALAVALAQLELKDAELRNIRKSA